MANTKKMQFLRHVVLGGKSFRPGDVAELADADAQKMLRYGFAEHTTGRVTPVARFEQPPRAELADADEAEEQDADGEDEEAD